MSIAEPGRLIELVTPAAEGYLHVLGVHDFSITGSGMVSFERRAKCVNNLMQNDPIKSLSVMFGIST